MLSNTVVNKKCFSTSEANSTQGKMSHESHAQDFGYPVAKKPKLSLNAAPSSSSALSQQNDSLWDEDFSELELDECFKLATQACSQFQHQISRNNPASASTKITQPIDSITKQSQNNGSAVIVSKKLAPSDIFNVPSGSNIAKDSVTTGKFRPKQWSNVANKALVSGVAITRPVIPSQSQHFASESERNGEYSSKFIPAMSSLKPNHKHLNHNDLLEKLKNDNAKLKEDFLTKDGEISILRIQLKQSDIKATCQLNLKMQEYEAKFRLMEKELEKAKTTVELQKLEAWKAKDKLLMVNQTATQNIPSVSTVQSKSVHYNQFGGFNKLSPIISYGELLLDAVTPQLFIKSCPEINLVELKTTFSLLDDTADRKRTVFNPIHYTVETCWEPTMQLGLEESFDTVTAHCHIKKIFSECYKILCCLLITLRERAEKETDYNLDSRDLQNARVKVDALDDPNLLSHEMWYTIERGVESRRALGLLAEVSELSKYMADLVTGTCQTRKDSTVIQQCNAIQEPHHVMASNCEPSTTLQTLFNDHVDKSLPSRSSEEVNSKRQPSVLHKNQSPQKIPSTQTPDLKEEQKSKIAQIESFYKSQDFGFLKLIRDVSQIVSSQSNSFEYSGFLTGVAKLFTNIQHNCSPIKYTTGFLSIFCVIVKTIIHSRPCMETTVTVAELIDSLVFNTEFMNALCNSAVEIRNHDSRDSMVQNDQEQKMCALSMLCWLLERETNSSRTRIRICQALVNWMTVGVKCRPFHGPKWTQCQKPSQADKCFCRTRMIEAMVILIYETFKDFELFANTSKQESIRSVLVRGIMLLYYQIESDPDFGHHMVDVEGYYQLLLMGLKNTEHNMRLDKHEGSALDELLAMEETITPPKFELTTSLEQHMDSVIATMELGWSEV